MALELSLNDSDAADMNLWSMIGSAMWDTLFGAALIAVATALPALVLVRGARWLRLPRGWTDAVLPAAISFAVIMIMIGPSGLNQEMLAISLQTAAIFALAAAIAGLTYWLLAGRPRPPY